MDRSAEQTVSFDRRAASRRVLTAIVLLCTCGCTTSLRDWYHNGFKVGPSGCCPPAPVASEWIEQGDPAVRSGEAVDFAWWTVFHDPILDGLVDTAYRQNLSLRVAGTRIMQARAQRDIAAGNLFPQRQSALADYAHAQLPGALGLPLPRTVSVWATGLNTSWEVDFWGRYRRAIEARDAELDASIYGYRDALVLLLSEVATNYVQLRTFEARLEFARHNVEIQRGSLGLADDRFRNGVTSDLDVRQARSNLAQTEATIPLLEVGRRQASNRLCILLGTPPSDLAKQLGPAPLPEAPPNVAVGVPAELLRRRPDVRRAERLVASQCAQIGIAEADLYPRFSLTGFIGYVGTDLNSLFSPKSFTGLIAPTFQWNLLNYGRIINNVRYQEARLQETVVQYQQTVLTAGREVEDALVGFVETRRQVASLATSVHEAERSVDLVISQYKGGIVDFNRVFTVQANLVGQQDQLASARGNIALNLIQVYRSLGGGWEYFANCPSPPVTTVRPEDLPPGGNFQEVPHDSAAPPAAGPALEPVPVVRSQGIAPDDVPGTPILDVRALEPRGAARPGSELEPRVVEQVGFQQLR